MPRGPNYLNGDFFKRNHSEVLYLLGAFLKTCSFSEDSNRIVFRSWNRDLIERVKYRLECDNIVRSDSRGKNSHSLEVANEGLRLIFEERGLGYNKRDRRFLEDISEDLVVDNIRGVIENECRSRKDIIKIVLTLPHNYLVKLNDFLIDYADVQKKKIKGDFIKYEVQDTKKIYNLIYQNRKRFRLPGIKEKFSLNPSTSAKMRIEREKKARRTKKLLLEGKRGVDIYKSLGFNAPVNFYMFLKRNDISIRDKEPDEKIKRIKKLLEKGHNGREVSRIMSFCSDGAFYSYLRRHTEGKGVRDFIN